jgi:putative ABC transport system permease protein
VVLINETLARREFPNEDPIGRRFRMGGHQPRLDATNAWGLPEWSTIVGVVSDVKSLHPHPEAVPEVYVPYWQWPMQNPTILVRTTGDPGALTGAIRRETQAAIPNVPSPSIRTMDDLLSEVVARPRLQTGLLSLFGVLVLGLAVVGLYGVLVCIVTQRRREIGVRLALGAQRGHVLALVLSQGMKMALRGVGVGIVAALGLTRVLGSLLYGVTPNDPATLAGVAVVVLLAALFACWVAARRAAGVDPMEALRCE